MSRSDWKKVIDAAGELGKHRDRVYRYLRAPEVETGIRRMTVGQTLYVHMPSLVAYAAQQKPGRPRKADERENPQHGESTRPSTP